MTDITTVVDSYIAMWNETDAERRRAHHRARHGPRTRPTSTRSCRAAGRDGIDAMIAGAQEQFPGHRFELAAGPDAHHDRVRFAWQLVGRERRRASPRASTSPLVADDGRLREVTGFLEAA